MKLILALSTLIFVLGVPALAVDQLFVGPSMGATSLSQANGSQTRESQFSFGLEEFQVWNHWAAGVSYKYISAAADGNQTIGVTQTSQWLSAEGKFRFWNENFSPYLSGGLGGILETVTTQVMTQSDRQNGVFLARTLGVGMAGRITGNIGINLSARYLQYSNLNGFDYSLSLGWFPSFMN